MVHDLGNDVHAVPARNLVKQLESFLAHALETVGRGPRLEGAAAHDLHALSADRFGRRRDLLSTLHRAGPRHHDHVVPPDPQVADLHHRSLGSEGATGQLVGLRDPHDFLDAVQKLVVPVVHDLPAHDAQDRTLDPRGPMNVEAVADQAVDDVLNLSFRGSPLHDDDHFRTPSAVGRQPAEPAGS